MSNATGLLMTLCATLQELHYDSIEEGMVMLLAEHCSTFKKLACHFHTNVTQESIQLLCCTNFQLVRIEFDGNSVTHDLILAILAACPAIKEVVLGEDGSAARFSLLSSHAIRTLTLLSVWPVECRIFSSDSSGRCCEVFFNEPVELNFLRTMPLPIRGITFRWRYGSHIAADLLRVLADSHGHTLEKCKLFLHESMNRTDLQYFLSRCPNMSDLSLNFQKRPTDLIDDTDMRNLSLWCPRIAKLELNCCAVAITDESVGYALKRWSANNITAFHLCDCQLLTDAVLPIIEKCCPQLHSMCVPSTSFSKEAVLQFVLNISNNWVFSSVEPPYELRDWLEGELRKHGTLWKRVKVC